jgi:hypothetical protein
MGRIPLPRIAALLGVSAALTLATAPAATAEMRVDTSFGQGGFVQTLDGVTPFSVSPGPDGTAIVVGRSTGGTLVVQRFLANGSFDLSYGNEGVVESDRGLPIEAVAHPDGSVTFIEFSTYSGKPPSTVTTVFRLDPEGDLDEDFGEGGRAPLRFGGPIRQVEDITLDPEGRILVLGDVSDRVFVTRLLPSGDPDPSFGDVGVASYRDPDFFEYQSNLVATPDGRVCSYGNSSAPDGTEHRDVICFDDDGTPALADRQPAPGGASADDIAALPGGGWATLYSEQRYTPVPGSQTFDSTTLAGSSLLVEPISFGDYGVRSWTSGRSLDQFDSDSMIAAGGAGETFGDARPMFLLLDATSPATAPLDSWRMTEGPTGQVTAGDTAPAGDGAFFALLGGVDGNDIGHPLTRVVVDGEPDSPRERDSLTLGRLRMPDSVGGLLRRGARISATCTSDCRVDLKLKLPRGLSKRLGLGRRLVDRYRGELEGGRKYLVRLPVTGRVARHIKARFVGPTSALRLRVGSRADFR